MDEEGLETIALIHGLSRGLHEAGVPAHQLEDAMSEVAIEMGMSAQFFSTPTSIFVSFDQDQGRTDLLRVEPGEVNLTKLTQLHHLQRSIMAGAVSVKEALVELAKINASPRPYSKVVQTLCFGLAGGSAAVFFGGGILDSMVSGCIGFVVGCVVLWLSSHSRARHLMESTAALAATLIATLTSVVARDFSPEIAMVSGLIVLVPGLGLTVAVNELATQNLASGTARLAGAITQFLSIAFGIILGRAAVAAIITVPEMGTVVPLSWPFVIVALPIAAVAFTVLFQARGRDFLWILSAGVLAFGGAKFCGQLAGPEVGAWTGAFLLGVGSNLSARLFERPTAVTLVPGMILLVPGSIGFKSISALLNDQVVVGMDAAFEMSVISASIVAGLLMANVLVPAVSKKRRSKEAMEQRSKGAKEQRSD